MVMVNGRLLLRVGGLGGWGNETRVVRLVHLVIGASEGVGREKGRGCAAAHGLRLQEWRW